MAKVVVIDPIHNVGIKSLQDAGIEVLLPQRYPDPAEIESGHPGQYGPGSGH